MTLSTRIHISFHVLALTIFATYMKLLTFLFLLSTTSAELQIAILMQGSDFINISIVPLFNVDQYDLGDVYISPCRAGTYNEARDSYCKDCSVCSVDQYQVQECISVQNSICANCTICTERDQEICSCGQRSGECITGNRVCTPLPATSINITFDLFVSSKLSPLKERFLQEGLRTGFVLYLSSFLQHSSDDIFLLNLAKNPTQSTVYAATFVVNNVYSLFTKSQVTRITQSVVQEGLINTFGIQSNTFNTVTRRRLLSTQNFLSVQDQSSLSSLSVQEQSNNTARRNLLQVNGLSLIGLRADNVVSNCVTLDGCGQFFVMLYPDSPCNSSCEALPCPLGYTGFYGLCELCPNATFKSTAGNDTCSPCPPTYSSDQGSTDISQCMPAPTTQLVTSTTRQSTTTASLPGSTTSMPGTTSTKSMTSSSIAQISETTTALQTPSPPPPPPSQPPPPPSTPSPPPSTPSPPPSPPPPPPSPPPPPPSPPPPPPSPPSTPPPPPSTPSPPPSQPPPPPSQPPPPPSQPPVPPPPSQPLYYYFYPGTQTQTQTGNNQYITVNTSQGESAMMLVCVGMVVAFFILGCIAARLFFVPSRQGGSNNYYYYYSKVKDEKEIIIPIRRPGPPSQVAPVWPNQRQAPSTVPARNRPSPDESWSPLPPQAPNTVPSRNQPPQAPNTVPARNRPSPNEPWAPLPPQAPNTVPARNRPSANEPWAPLPPQAPNTVPARNRPSPNPQPPQAPSTAPARNQSPSIPQPWAPLPQAPSTVPARNQQPSNPQPWAPLPPQAPSTVPARNQPPQAPTTVPAKNQSPQAPSTVPARNKPPQTPSTVPAKIQPPQAQRLPPEDVVYKTPVQHLG